MVVGSAWQPCPQNPFTWQERRRPCCAKHYGARPRPCTGCCQWDYYNEAVWVQAVRTGVAITHAARARIALVGHFKDATSSYLRAFWSLIDLPARASMDATTIRDAYFKRHARHRGKPSRALGSGDSASTIAAAVSRRTEYYPALQEEWRMLHSYRDAWAAAPYPPVFCDGGRRAALPGDHVARFAVPTRPAIAGSARRLRWSSAKPCGNRACANWQKKPTATCPKPPCAPPCNRWPCFYDHRPQPAAAPSPTHYFDLGNAPARGAGHDDDALQAEGIPCGPKLPHWKPSSSKTTSTCFATISCTITAW